MKYRIELGSKIWKKGEKIHILGKFRKVYRYMYRGVPVHPIRGQSVPVHVRGVPVHPVLFSQFRPVFVF